MMWPYILCISFVIVIAAGPGLKLNIDGLQNDSCKYSDPLQTTQTCHYSFGDDKIGSTVPFKCVFRRTVDAAKKKATYQIKFGTFERTVELKRGEPFWEPVTYPVTLVPENQTVICTATKKGVNLLKTTLNIYYIPSITTTTEPTTTAKSPTFQVTVNPSDSEFQTSTGEDSSIAWLQWVLAGGALLLTVCIVAGCIVKYRQKTAQPAESTYTNMAKDQNSYQTMPTPARRAANGTNATPKPNAARPNVALENNYSEPKDSQDMSEALYADPNRFNGDSEHYAEPYVKKQCSKSGTYVEPYKSNYSEPYAVSEGNYAELKPVSRDLYSQPIPKAQRKKKVKDDSNYSNVFGAEYGNAKK